jgi:hypothetical protein
VRCGAVRRNAARFGAVRCGAVECGAVRCGGVLWSAVRCGAGVCVGKKKKNILFCFVSVLLAASVERVGVSRMRDFYLLEYYRVVGRSSLPYR